jgi:hypothetical protein
LARAVRHLTRARYVSPTGRTTDVRHAPAATTRSCRWSSRRPCVPCTPADAGAGVQRPLSGGVVPATPARGGGGDTRASRRWRGPPGRCDAPWWQDARPPRAACGRARPCRRVRLRTTAGAQRPVGLVGLVRVVDVVAASALAYVKINETLRVTRAFRPPLAHQPRKPRHTRTSPSTCDHQLTNPGRVRNVLGQERRICPQGSQSG